MADQSRVEQLEEAVAKLGATPSELFRLWFDNHVPEHIRSQFWELEGYAASGKAVEANGDTMAPYASPDLLAVDLLGDVVDVWLETWGVPDEGEDDGYDDSDNEPIDHDI